MTVKRSTPYKEYRISFDKIAGTFAVIQVVVIGIYLFFKGILHKEDFWTLVKSLTIINAVSFGAWWYLDRVGWKTKPFIWFSDYFKFPPDLNGTWIGILDREGENNPHTFKLHIKQTWSSIFVKTESGRNRSDSLIAEIASNNSGDFFLCYFWQGDLKELKQGKTVLPSSIVNGYTILEYKVETECVKLDGYYFTNRTPQQTMGNIELIKEKLV